MRLTHLFGLTLAGLMALPAAHAGKKNNVQGELKGGQLELKCRNQGHKCSAVITLRGDTLVVRHKGAKKDRYTFKKADVKRISFRGSNKNDHFENRTNIPCDVKGGQGADYLDGGSGDDHIDGQRGNDTIDGGAGNDVLNGGEGDDTMFGGLGDDTVKGNQGDDKLEGGPGNDRLDGGKGEDKLMGDSGDDQLLGGKDQDQLWGGPGKDRCNAQGHDRGARDRCHDSCESTRRCRDMD